MSRLLLIENITISITIENKRILLWSCESNPIGIEKTH